MPVEDAPNTDPNDAGKAPEGTGKGDTGNNTDPNGNEPGNTKSVDEGTDWEAEAKKWKELSRKHETRAKENYEKVQKYDEWQKAQMTEAERAAADLEERNKELATLKRDLALKDVAIEYGLTADDLKWLRYTPADEVEEAARELAERLKASSTPGRTTYADGKPKDGKPIDVDPKQDMESLEEQIAKARTERNMPLVVALQTKKAELVKGSSTQ